MASEVLSQAPVERVAPSRLWLAGPATIVAAVAVNLIVRQVALALFDIAPEFLPLSDPGPAIFFTTVGTLAATLVFALVAWRSRRPVSRFRVVAVIALLLSFAPNILILLNPAGMPVPGVTPASVGTLMAMHLPPAILSMTLLPSLARAR